MKTIPYAVVAILFALSFFVVPSSAKASRFDRTKFHIGVWRFRDYLHDEPHVKELAECGVDFVCIGKGWDDRKLLDLFHKYGIGIMASGPVPRWGTWLKSGGWEKTHPPSGFRVFRGGELHVCNSKIEDLRGKKVIADEGSVFVERP